MMAQIHQVFVNVVVKGQVEAVYRQRALPVQLGPDLISIDEWL